MAFFGDTMRSYGVRKINGVQYMYRRPDATVNVFGTRKLAGRTFFNAWRFDLNTNDLNSCNPEETAVIWRKLGGNP
jgi:hypothetical protein